MVKVKDSIRLDLPENYLWWHPKSDLKDLLVLLFGSTKGPKAYRIVRDRIGASVGSKNLLGVGDQGAVYELPDGRGLKITMDDGELWTGTFLRNEGPFEGLPDVYDVFAVVDQRRRKGVGILARQLVSLEPPPDLDGILDVIKKADEKFLYGARTRREMCEEMGAFIDGLRSMRMPEIYRGPIEGFTIGLEALLDAGYCTEDILFNVGFDGPEPILFDVSAWPAKPPKVETIWI